MWMAGLILLLVTIVIGVVNGINAGQSISEIFASNAVIIIAFAAFVVMRIFLFKGEEK
jgi:hypothetical protein